MKPVSLRDLAAIQILGTRRNFRAAALELGVSPPTLSHMVASVEERIGIRLFNRTTRSVAPTEAGEMLIRHMSPALTTISDAFAIIDGLKDSAIGRLRLNASEVAAARLLPAIAKFMQLYPGIEVELASDGLLSDIVAEGFDAGIRLAEAVPQDMIALPLSQDEQLIVVASPQYLDEHGTPVDPEQLDDHDCIVARLPSGRAMAWEFEAQGRAFNVAVKGRMQVGSVALAYEAAKLGLGLAYVSLSEAQAALEDGDLKQILAEWTPPFEGLRLYYPRQRHHSAAFRAFLDYVKRNQVKV